MPAEQQQTVAAAAADTNDEHNKVIEVSDEYMNEILRKVEENKKKKVAAAAAGGDHSAETKEDGQSDDISNPLSKLTLKKIEAKATEGGASEMTEEERKNKALQDAFKQASAQVEHGVLKDLWSQEEEDEHDDFLDRYMRGEIPRIKDPWDCSSDEAIDRSVNSHPLTMNRAPTPEEIENNMYLQGVLMLLIYVCVCVCICVCVCVYLYVCICILNRT